MEKIFNPITLYSSGTTKGVRRPVVRDKDNLDAHIQDLASNAYLPKFLTYDICLPMDHIFGYTMYNILKLKGCKCNVHTDLMRAKPKGTVLITTPRLAKLYYKRGCKAKIWVSGSEPFNGGLPERCAILLEGYGMSETGVISCSTLFNFRLGSVGKPVMPYKIDTEGVLWVKPKGFSDFYRTGDLASVSKDGYLYIHGRRDDIYK